MTNVDSYIVTSGKRTANKCVYIVNLNKTRKIYVWSVSQDVERQKTNGIQNLQKGEVKYIQTE